MHRGICLTLVVLTCLSACQNDRQFPLEFLSGDLKRMNAVMTVSHAEGEVWIVSVDMRDEALEELLPYVGFTLVCVAAYLSHSNGFASWADAAPMSGLNERIYTQPIALINQFSDLAAYPEYQWPTASAWQFRPSAEFGQGCSAFVKPAYHW